MRLLEPIRAHLHDPVGAPELEHERVADERRTEPTLERFAGGRGDRAQVVRAPEAGQARVELHDRRRGRRHARHVQSSDGAGGDSEEFLARALQRHRIHVACNKQKASSGTVGVVQKKPGINLERKQVDNNENRGKEFASKC